MYNKWVFSILTLFALASCKKVQPKMADAKNPCDCSQEVSANFKMGEMYGDNFIELDTIIMPINYQDGKPANFIYLNTVYVYFSANIKNAESYEWQVGNNSIKQTVKDFGLYFSDTIGPIPVQLIVHAKPNLKCFPNDDGVDTIVKYLSIKHKTPHPLIGKYYGYNTNDPTHYFTVEIDTTTKCSLITLPQCQNGLCIRNLPEGKNEWVGLSRELGSQSYCFTGASDESQPYPKDFVLYNEDHYNFKKCTRGIYNRQTKEIVIDYFSAPVIDKFHLGTPFPERRFIGKRI